ncbi:MAG: 30S ribosome-binding factor RbfA [Cellulosilyticaceae bacterium]
MANQRIIRINEAIRKELSDLIRFEIKDPRVNNTMVSVLDVETTTDLKHCKVFISVLDDSKKEDVLNGLVAAGGFLRKEVARRVNLRNTPQFTFKLDESIQYGMHMSKMISDVMKDTESKEDIAKDSDL